ncbi:hypothetical protein FE391_26040 [Nonomuraea sp. KC401]|uniref:hypothetical protein n=1 Tax=unclassified Nonomuraea TaxID=2593643 RepID=UPI0010FDAFA5|nr:MULTISPECIES: hypothetical protein [unclassified Nonomuraea]NBE97221.1 hypothetical protein [Nonomuraea sp. K271]TLF65915.1 hypothetical protein FE391_26040 [Nonomuraea sp. KC401]
MIKLAFRKKVDLPGGSARVGVVGAEDPLPGGEDLAVFDCSRNVRSLACPVPGRHVRSVCCRPDRLV